MWASSGHTIPPSPATSSPMIGFDISGLYTLSGLLFVGGALMYVLEHRVLAATMLVVAGAGGCGGAWDRWSARTGEHVHLTAFFSPVAPSAGELTMLATHVPMLVTGLVLLALATRRTRSYD